VITWGEAVKFVIVGNSIDSMKGEAKTPKTERYEHTEKRLQKAKKLVYICDNCGEIYFDKLLLETIKVDHNIDVTFITRSLPVINDATVSNAMSADMDKGPSD
jgi:damage-control phosphatase, subfamily I